MCRITVFKMYHDYHYLPVRGMWWMVMVQFCHHNHHSQLRPFLLWPGNKSFTSITIPIISSRLNQERNTTAINICDWLIST